MKTTPTEYKVVNYNVVSGKGTIPSVTVKLEGGGNLPIASSAGTDPVNAMFNAMKKATGLDIRVVEFNRGLVDSRVDSVDLTLEINGWRFRGYGNSTELVDAAVNACLSALNKSQQEIGARKPRPYSDFDGHGTLMFFYVPSAEVARTISHESFLGPVVEISSMLSDYGRPHVNLTNVKPEEGRKAVEAAMPSTSQAINYGLELIVDGRRLTQPYEQFPRWFQIFSEEPVPVKVAATRKMDKIERGVEIRRFVGKNGHPYSYYVPPHKR